MKSGELVQQGGVVEKLVLKSNKFGAEGWRHICLFIHMCRSLKHLDLSLVPFPSMSESVKTPYSRRGSTTQLDLAVLLSNAIGERLAGPELELLNLGGTGLKTDQLGIVVDGIIKSGLTRFGLASLGLDSRALQHVARYMREGKCHGLDLGDNDLREQLEVIAGAVSEDNGLWALSLANCKLKPSSLCKLFPELVKLKEFKFLDLSHNQDLFNSEPSAVAVLRK